MDKMAISLIRRKGSAAHRANHWVSAPRLR